MIFGKRTERHQTRKAEGRQKADESENADYGRPKAAGDQEARAELRAIESGEKTRSVWNCVYGNVARVVYSRTFYSLTTPLTGRLNKSPHTVHAIATCHRLAVLTAYQSFPRKSFLAYMAIYTGFLKPSNGRPASARGLFSRLLMNTGWRVNAIIIDH